MTTSERIAKGQYTDGKRWYLTSGVPIRGTEGNYSDIMDIASEEATRPERQRQERALMEQNLEYNLGPNWRDIYDLDTRQYKDGYSAADGDGGRLAIIAQGGADIGSRYGGGSQGYRTDYGNMQVEALQRAMQNNQNALRESYDASMGELDSAIKQGQRQAYVNQQKALKTLPQTMAAAGYSGGMTESTAANIANEYQNAFNDLQRTRAAEAARLQANLANGIANTDTQYQIQIADALQAAQQFAQQQQQYEEQMALQRAAAALEQDRYEREWARDQQEYADQLALQQRQLAIDEARYGVGGAGNASPSTYTTYIGGKKYTGVYQGQDGRTYGRNSNGTLVDLTDMNPF